MKEEVLVEENSLWMYECRILSCSMSTTTTTRGLIIGCLISFFGMRERESECEREREGKGEDPPERASKK